MRTRNSREVAARAELMAPADAAAQSASHEGDVSGVPIVAALAVARLAAIEVPADLLQRALDDYSRRAATGAPAPLSAIIHEHVVTLGLPGDPNELVLAARLRILALACVVRDGLLEEWVRRGDPGGSVLFHASLFEAAAAEPLVLLPPDGIGFDPESLRRNVLQAAAVKGRA